MKKQLAVLALTTILLTGCATTKKTSSIQGCSTLNILNWGEYIDPTLLTNFEKQYQIKVTYDMMDSNEAFYTKLQADQSYDIVVPSDYMIERLIHEDLIQPLDPDQIPNLDGLVTNLQDLPFNQDKIYGIPYLWGSWGLVYNKTTVDQNAIEQLGYDIFTQPDMKNRAYMYDSIRNGFMVGLKALGYSMNTTNEQEIQAAYDWLNQANQKNNFSFVTDEVIDAMLNEQKDVALMYSGDAAYILSQNENLGYVVPKQGTNIWVDAMVMPKNAQCQQGAYAFMNYMYEYENALANSTFVGYTSPLQDVVDELTSQDGPYANNPAYLPPANRQNDEILHDLPQAKEMMAELWIKIKNK